MNEREGRASKHLPKDVAVHWGAVLVHGGLAPAAEVVPKLQQHTGGGGPGWAT